jgi:peptidyl-prolyl cis-trans isomerase C
MKFRTRKIAASLMASVALAVGLVAVKAHADQAAEDARRAQVCARIGSHAVTVGDLEDRMAKVPRYQLLTFGADADSIRRKFLNDVVAPDILYSVDAEAQHVDQRRVVQQALARAKAEAAKREVRMQAESTPVSPDDVKQYYNAHLDTYVAPTRYGVWRILCKTREEAAAVLDAAKKKPTPENFTDLARVHSIDKATAMRGGNLGFVGLDGASNEAGLHVDPAIAKAASLVKDGELVAAPVAENAGGTPGFSVVWHRGTVGASTRTLEQVSGQIRDTISKNRGDDAVKNLIADLRAKNVHDENDSLLKSIDIAQGDGAIVPRKRTGQVPALKSSF